MQFDQQIRFKVRVLLANITLGFRMVYLHLTLVYSKDQSQGHTNFDWEYLVNGDRWSKYYYCKLIGSCLLAFEWCVYIWPWLNLNVKVIRNSIANNSIKLSHAAIRACQRPRYPFLSPAYCLVSHGTRLWVVLVLVIRSSICPSVYRSVGLCNWSAKILTSRGLAFELAKQ